MKLHSISPAHIFFTIGNKVAPVPSMVGSTVVMLLTVTFVPQLVPMICEFYGSNGRALVGIKHRETA